MKAYIGTSGWMYSWNKDKSLDWYVKNSKLNAIELNASFYRFPFPAQIKRWSEIGKNLRWSIKVNQMVTHRHKLNEKSYEVFSKFKRLFSPLDKNIDFYLFQLPPILTNINVDRMEKFQKKFNLGERMAIEFRNKTWLNKDTYKRIKEMKATIVSVDSPQFRFIMKTDKKVYLRLHGRKEWYNYKYSRRELTSIVNGIKDLTPISSYIFFNNDHRMLENARETIDILNIS